MYSYILFSFHGPKKENPPKNQEVLKYSHEKQNFYARADIFWSKAKKLFFLFIFLLEFIYTAGCIHQNVLARKEGV